MANLNTDLDWATTRLQAINQFNGETPRTDTEAAIIDVFELAPRAVLRAIDEVAQALHRGEARSGWAVLRARLSTSAEPVRDITIRGADERSKRIRQAETMIRNAGRYHPPDRDDPNHSSELDDDLFGDRGLLRPWADDHALHERTQKLWRELQPAPELEAQPAAAHPSLDDWVTDEPDERE